MTLLILGLVIFLGVHSVSIIAPGWRDARVASLGERPWKGLYAIASLAGFVLLVVGYSLARQAPVVLYTPPAALRHVALLLMLPVFRSSSRPTCRGASRRRPNIRCCSPPSSGPRHTCAPTAASPTCCCSAAFSPGRWPTASR